ncbi:YdcF family protein [Paenibacillus sp. TRM 82003]|nr:YdcF family protein [Paenibacillus sp. TRM 82003]
MRLKHKLLLVVGLMAVIAASLHTQLFAAAGSFLKLDCEALASSDVIIVLGGEADGERTRKAAELYREGIAPKLMISDGTKMSWRTTAMKEMYDLAVLEGVKPEDIVKEDRSRSTYENALYTKELMLEHGFDSALVVTTDWHGKRSRFIFEKVYKVSDIQLSYCGTPDARSDFAAWWKDGEKQQVVLTEWAKTLVYWAKYSF